MAGDERRVECSRRPGFSGDARNQELVAGQGIVTADANGSAVMSVDSTLIGLRVGRPGVRRAFARQDRGHTTPTTFTFASLLIPGEGRSSRHGKALRSFGSRRGRVCDRKRGHSPGPFVGVTSTQAILLRRSGRRAPAARLFSIRPTNGARYRCHAVCGRGQRFADGQFANGMSRIVVVGQRKSDLAADGKMYSRALQADAAYRVSGELRWGFQHRKHHFRTRTIPLAIQCPTVSVQQRRLWQLWISNGRFFRHSKTYIDPQTGILLKRLTTPGYGSPGQHVSLTPLYAYDLSGLWNNPKTFWRTMAGTRTTRAPAALRVALYSDADG